MHPFIEKNATTMAVSAIVLDFLLILLLGVVLFKGTSPAPVAPSIPAVECQDHPARADIAYLRAQVEDRDKRIESLEHRIQFMEQH